MPTPGNLMRWLQICRSEFDEFAHGSVGSRYPGHFVAYALKLQLAIFSELCISELFGLGQGIQVTNWTGLMEVLRRNGAFRPSEGRPDNSDQSSNLTSRFGPLWRTLFAVLVTVHVLFIPLSSAFSFQPPVSVLRPSHRRQTSPATSRVTWSRTQTHGWIDRSRLLKLYSSTSSSGSSDATEWNAVLAALRMYKAAYGDLKVPQRFVVPTMSPWPKESWGVKLGKVVATIRATGKYLDAAELMEPVTTARRQALEELGFVWRMRQDTSTIPPEQVPMDQLYRALLAYREIIVGRRAGGQSWSVPPTFYIPDLDPWPETVRGLPLGQQLNNLKRRLSKNKELKDRFQSLGLDILEDKDTNSELLSANDIRFQNVYEALKTYKRIYGDLLVPQPYVVPKTNDWPKETWGLRLGARVNAIRSQGTFVNNNPERRELLDDLEFVWSTPKEVSRRRGRKSSSDFDDENQDREIDDEVEQQEDFEESGEEEWNIAGGDMDSLFDESFDFVKDFDFSADGGKPSPTWGLVEGGGSMAETIAPSQDEAPAEDDYTEPQSLEESLALAFERALEVGVVEGMTDNKRVIKGKQQKEIPWFNDDFGGDFVFEDVVEALKTYKAIYGDFANLTVNDGFVVPTATVQSGFLDDDEAPFAAFDVDASARAAAAIANYEGRGDLEENEDPIAAEIRRLQGKVGSLVSVIPKTSSEARAVTEKWPEHLSGMVLGSIVSRIRDGSLEVKHKPERKARLDAIGFDWGDPMYFIDVPFEKAMCAMYAYYLIRGDMFVYEDFVMPDEDPWPQALAGFEIGKAVIRLRQLQNFLEAYHPEKVGLLRMIDFVWFPTMALPLDPNETEMNSEMLLLGAMGHPDYAKMIDIPMGLPDKIMADGPFLDSDDPKLWWRKWHNWDYVKDYWYQQGRRDNAYVLREMGYRQMADEHEAKYGPGLFAQINETMEEIEKGLDGKTADQKKEILTKLNFYRQEMLGCTDIPTYERYELLADLDAKMIAIMEDSDIRIAGDIDFDPLEMPKREGLGPPSEYSAFSEEDFEKENLEGIDEDLEMEEFEVDIDDELGLGQ